MGTPSVGIFMKAPRVGEVKTRLGESIGMRNAAEFYATALGWLFRRLDSAGIPFVVFYDPPDSEEYIRRLYQFDADQRLCVQEGEDLGERMHNALAWLSDETDGAPLIIGSDSPDLPTEWIKDGVEALEHNEVVLGPARDGGYYLIGTRRPGPDLFEGIEWSTSRVLTDTLERVKQRGHHPYMLPPWRDIDTLEDLMARM